MLRFIWLFAVAMPASSLLSAGEPLRFGELTLTEANRVTIVDVDGASCLQLNGPGQGKAWARIADDIGDVTLHAEFRNVDRDPPSAWTHFGFAVRVTAPDHYEIFYVNPQWSGERNTLKHVPQLNGRFDFRPFDKPGFIATAKLPKDWISVTLRLRGSVAEMSVGDAANPQGQFTLRGDNPRGGIALWAYPSHIPTLVRNIRIEPAK